MFVSGFFSGGAPVIKKYQVAQTVSVANSPLLASTGAEPGLDAPTTTNLADWVGLCLDTATYVTAQQTDGTKAERTVSCVINPDIIVKARLSGSGTAGAALTRYDITTATTDGLDVTTGDDFSGTTRDSGSVWGYTGANAGQLRKITAVSTTAITVVVAFENDHQVGDEFLVAPVSPMEIDTVTVTLTSDFTEIDCSVATATNTARLQCIELLARGFADNGTTNSWGLFVPSDHFLNKIA